MPGLSGVLRAVEARDEAAVHRALARLSDDDLAEAEITIAILNGEQEAEAKRRKEARHV